MRALAAGLAVALPLGLAELGLRVAGRTPWRPGRVHSAEPTMLAPHPTRGWANAPGVFRYPGYVPGAAEVVVTIQADGARATAPERADGRPRVLLIGCSFTHGKAVSDAETFAWQAQAALPELELVNHGTSAYGTYQALLLLEELLAAEPQAPRWVVLGFASFQARRNVAGPAWLRSLAERAAGGAPVALPYCELTETGELRRRPPVTYPSWPGAGRSALVAGLQEARVQLAGRARQERRHAVTRALLAALHQRCQAAGTRLLVMCLNEVGPYLQFLERQGIAALDARHPRLNRAGWVVAGEGHPNARMHAFWGERLAERLRTDRKGRPKDER